MAYLAAFFAFLLAGCATSPLPQTIAAAGPVIKAAAIPFRNVDVCREALRAAFHANHNTIEYYSLNGAAAHYVGTASIDIPDCKTGYYGLGITFDQQHKIDVYRHCNGVPGSCAVAGALEQSPVSES